MSDTLKDLLAASREALDWMYQANAESSRQYNELRDAIREADPNGPCPACDIAREHTYYRSCDDCADGDDVGVGGYPVFEGSEAQAFGPGPYTQAEQERNARGGA